ncbi:MAG TPA: HAD family hydrolase [Allosphingosinicella sp.]|nr:HAD family hydrolase [Allosphingosinicella sp.]
MVRAALFDVDGTLIDSNDLHAAAWQQAFRHFGVDLPYEQVRGQIGKGGDNLVPALLPSELVERRQQEIEDFRSELFKRDYLPRALPFPCVRPLFERLRAQGVRIVLATSAHADELDHHLELLGCRDLIEATTSQDDVDHSKPCPDIFAAALAKVAPTSAEDAVVVGDTPYDAEAAGRLGLRTIGVRCGGFPEADLRAAGAVELYDGPEDLLRRYDRSLLARRGQGTKAAAAR